MAPAHFTKQDPSGPGTGVKGSAISAGSKAEYDSGAPRAGFWPIRRREKLDASAKYRNQSTLLLESEVLP